MNFVHRISDKLKKRFPTLWQLASFLLLGGITGIIDLGLFALCNYLIFTPYASKPFVWFVFDYGTENGGLCAFLAFAVSFAASQTFNFFIQRKKTFNATNNAVVSGIMYAVMIAGTYFVVLWLPSLAGGAIYGLFGEKAGAIVLKLLSQSVSAAIQFPINKWIIMRRD